MPTAAKLRHNLLCPFCFPEPLAKKAMRFLRKPRNYAGLSL